MCRISVLYSNHRQCCCIDQSSIALCEMIFKARISLPLSPSRLRISFSLSSCSLPSISLSLRVNVRLPACCLLPARFHDHKSQISTKNKDFPNFQTVVARSHHGYQNGNGKRETIYLVTVCYSGVNTKYILKLTTRRKRRTMSPTILDSNTAQQIIRQSIIDHQSLVEGHQSN